jgi:regulatory protein
VNGHSEAAVWWPAMNEAGPQTNNGSRRDVPVHGESESSHADEDCATITALKPVRRNAARVELHIDGEVRGTVASLLVSEAGLRVGDHIPASRLRELFAGDVRWRAIQAALSLLAVRGRARGELADRLRRKGFDGVAVEHAVQHAERLGLVDDDAFSESWVRDRLALRPRGSKALVAELRRKGVTADTARAAVSRVMAAKHVGDEELCLAAAERWLMRNAALVGSDDRTRTTRRLFAFLARRGFATGASRDAVERVLPPRGT